MYNLCSSLLIWRRGSGIGPVQAAQRFGALENFYRRNIGLEATDHHSVNAQPTSMSFSRARAAKKRRAIRI